MLQVWQDVQAGSRPSTWYSISAPLSHSLCSVQIKSPSVSPFFLFSFTTSYSVPSPDPFHEPKISRDIYRPAERKTTSKQKADIFFTLRSLSWWLLHSVTESFWQKILWFVNKHMAARPFTSADSCRVKVILCNRPLRLIKDICFVLGLLLYIAVTKVFETKPK